MPPIGLGLSLSHYLSHSVVIGFLPISHFRLLEGWACVSLTLAYFTPQLSQGLTQNTSQQAKKKFVNERTSIASPEPDV